MSSRTSGPSQKTGAAAEVYGFVGWMTSFVALGCYILWAFLPDSMLHSIGITYYPNRYWAVAIPTYLLVAVCFGLFAYTCINMIGTAPLESLNTFQDSRAKQDSAPSIPVPESIPDISDIPIHVVNRLMFSRTTG